MSVKAQAIAVVGEGAVRKGIIVAALMAAVFAGALARPAAAAESRELQAREAFAAGRFQDALDLFAKLYAETLHPTYLRNIGRCYQNLGDPDRAITSFREYLRKAKHLSRSEQAEVEGYIKDMETLKRDKAEAAARRTEPEPAKLDPGPPPPPPPPTHLDATPGARPGAEEHPLIVTEKVPPPRDEPAPIYRRWWFWAIVGGVVLAGGAGAWAATRSSSKADPACTSPMVCQ